MSSGPTLDRHDVHDVRPYFYVFGALLVPSIAAVLWEPGEGLVVWPRIRRLVDFLERHLVTNTPAGGAYSTVAAWKGAYLSAPVEPDPWGNRYAVNTQFLKATNPATLTSNDVFVLSAGPDEQIDTVFTKNGITPGDDDIINVVRRDLNATVP